MNNLLETLDKIVKGSGYKLEIETSYDHWNKETNMIASCGCAYGKSQSLEEAVEEMILDAKELGYYE